MIQAQIDVKVNSTSESTIFDDAWHSQFRYSIELMQKYKPNLVIYPETFYNDSYSKDIFKDLTQDDKLIVAGSIYYGSENNTICFYKGNKICIPKANPSPLEIASRYMSSQGFDDLYENEIWANKLRTFYIKDKKIIVLNCMEYYNSAYFISRSKKYNQNLFGIACPCSSSNINLFEMETAVISNHQENIHTFLCNRVSPHDKSRTKDGSYIYGPITKAEKKFLKQDFPSYSVDHICGVIRLNHQPSWIYSEFATGSNLSPYGRSDNFMVTPKNTVIGLLEV